jgi:hypothetical protein
MGAAEACVLPTGRLRWITLTTAAWCAGLAAFTAAAASTEDDLEHEVAELTRLLG